MAEWMQTDTGVWERTMKAAPVPDFHCWAALKVCPWANKGDDGLELRDPEGRLPIRLLSSTPDIDLDGEIVEPAGAAEFLEEHNRNPVLLAYHDMKQPAGMAPIRIAKDGLWSDPLSKSNPGGAFISLHAGTHPGQIQGLVMDGSLPGASLGFVPVGVEFDEDLEVLRHVKFKIIEKSLVPLPANPSTFVEAVTAWGKSFAKSWRPGAPTPEPEPEPERAEVPPPAIFDLGPSIRTAVEMGKAVTAATGSVAAILVKESRE
jgi:hypothetical protein